MAKLSPDTVLAEIKAGIFAPVYILQGDEGFFVDQITNAIEAAALPESAKGFNQNILYGKETDMGKVINYARSFPMMADRQVVIVREAQDFADFSKAEPAKILAKYFDNPLDTTVLVFGLKGKNLDARTSLGKVADTSKHVKLVDCKKIPDYKLTEWLGKHLKAQHTAITPQATNLLVEYIGNDLDRLVNEVEKITINLTKGESITPDHVQKYVGISREYNIFELQKALVQRNLSKCLLIINYFKQDPKKNPLIPNISLLFKFFTSIMLCHQETDKSQSNLASVLRIPPFVVKDYLDAMRTFNYMKCVYAVGHLHEADLRSKGVEWHSGDDADILTELVFKIISI